MTKTWKLLLVTLCGATLLVFQAGCGKDGKKKETDAGTDTEGTGDTGTGQYIYDIPTSIDIGNPEDLQDTGDGEKCLPDTCNGHGTCIEAGGEVSCECDDGYTGDGCEECADGYKEANNGECEPVQGAANVTEENFCEEVSRIVCDTVMTCCDHNVIQEVFGVAQVWSSVDACKRDLDLFCQENFDVLLYGFDADSLALITESANSCLDAMLPTETNTCFRIETGAAAAGDVMRDVAECEAMVQGAVPAGGACHPELFGDAECADDDYFCSISTKTCTEKADPGEACADHTPCKSSGICVDGVCFGLLDLNEQCSPWEWPAFINGQRNEGGGCRPPYICTGYSVDLENDTRSPGTCLPPAEGVAIGEECGPGKICADGTQCRPGHCNASICYGDYDDDCVGECKSALTAGNQVGLPAKSGDKAYPDYGNVMIDTDNDGYHDLFDLNKDGYIDHIPQPPDSVYVKKGDPCAGDDDCTHGACVVGSQVVKDRGDTDGYKACDDDGNCAPRCSKKPERFIENAELGIEDCSMDAGTGIAGYNNCRNFCDLDDAECDPDAGIGCQDQCSISEDPCETLPDGGIDGCSKYCKLNQEVDCSADDALCTGWCNNEDRSCDSDDECAGQCDYWEGLECDNDSECPKHCEFDADSYWFGWDFWWCDDAMDCPGTCDKTGEACHPHQDDTLYDRDEFGRYASGSVSDCPDHCFYGKNTCETNQDCRDNWPTSHYDYCYMTGYCINSDGLKTGKSCDSRTEICPGDTRCVYYGSGNCMSATDDKTVGDYCTKHEDCDVGWYTEDFCMDDWCNSEASACVDDTCTEGECLEDTCVAETCETNTCITGDTCVPDTCTMETCEGEVPCEGRACDEYSMEVSLCQFAQDFLGFFYFAKPEITHGTFDRYRYKK